MLARAGAKFGEKLPEASFLAALGNFKAPRWRQARWDPLRAWCWVSYNDLAGPNSPQNGWFMWGMVGEIFTQIVGFGKSGGGGVACFLLRLVLQGHRWYWGLWGGGGGVLHLHFSQGDVATRNPSKTQYTEKKVVATWSPSVHLLGAALNATNPSLKGPARESMAGIPSHNTLRRMSVGSDLPSTQRQFRGEGGGSLMV